MASSSRRSSGPVLPISSAFQRSISPSGRFSSSASSGAATSAFASSSSSSFSTRSGASFFHRSASPTRVNLVPSQSVRFSLSHHHRPTSPGRSLSVADQIPSHRPVAGGGAASPGPAPGRRTCMCSPTTHPGSFRCSLHKGFHGNGSHRSSSSSSHAAASSPSNRLNARRSAMTNSLVRIGTVEGDLVKRALAALIRPSSHHQRRRSGFQPRPSRLSIMSKADESDL